MVVYEKIKPLFKRIPTVTDVTDKVQRYDLDNLYPQRANEIAKWSHTLKSVLDRYADFLNGEGFQDQTIALMKWSRKGGLKGMTANDVLSKVTSPGNYSSYKGFCLHINYNLNYRICEITPIKWEYVRLGDKDRNGKINYIQYSTNWERDSRKELSVDRKVITYDRFNPDPLVVSEQIMCAGGIDQYKGQMLYYTPEEDEYPLATFNAVMDPAQAQAELAMFKVAITQNKFLADLGIVYPGEFESEKEKIEFEELIGSKSGARNAGKRIGIQDKSGTKKASDIFTVLNPANTDKIYEFTEKSIVDAITECYGIPKELIGIRPETGMFNQDNMENAYTYFNASTRNDRAIISRIFSMLMEYWEVPTQNACVIKPQQYNVDFLSGTDNIDVRDNLANMTGRQNQNLGRIIRQYAQGKISYEQAKIQLQGGYGFTNEEIDKLLGRTEEIPPEPAKPADQSMLNAFKVFFKELIK